MELEAALKKVYGAVVETDAAGDAPPELRAKRLPVAGESTATP